MHLLHLVGGEQAEVAQVPVRSNEDVAGRVRELVHDRDRKGAVLDDELLLRLAEDAAVELVRMLDVGEAPGCPERLRHPARVRDAASFWSFVQ